MQTGVVGPGCVGVNLSRRRAGEGPSSMGCGGNPAGAPSASFTRSRRRHGFAKKILSALRFGFDGHARAAKK